MSLAPGSRFASQLLLATEADEGFPAISPDGKMLAYAMSTSRGDWRVFVRPFPSGEGQREIAPGVLPRWSGDGRTLYYQNWAELHSVSVEPARDGRHVALVQFSAGDAAKADTSHVVLVFDWTDELKKLFEETRR